MKNIILCADDFGQNPEISQGIAQLLSQQRLSATSCMTTGEHWLAQAELLKPFAGKVDIGLHFNLTHGNALTSMPSVSSDTTFPTLEKLLIKSYLKSISQDQIERELIAQIAAFEKALGRLPDYVDGHQHVHQFPVVREAMIKVYLGYYPEKKAYIRALNFTPKSPKAWILQLLGAKKLIKQLSVQGIPHNTSFSGVYNLRPTENYRILFQSFLAESQSNGIIMCHPGLASKDNTDIIKHARIKEYHYLSSDAFIEDCIKANVTIQTFN